jgi:hypothetical protein
MIPRIERCNNSISYYCGDYLHREGEPAIIFYNGTKFWYNMGRRHREDGPAIEYSNGDREWFYNGRRHRTDGPAIEWNNGGVEYWIEGSLLTEREYIQWVKNSKHN